MTGNYKPRSVTLDMIAALGLIASVEANPAGAHGLGSSQELKLAAETLASPGVQVEYLLSEQSWTVSPAGVKSVPSSPPVSMAAQSVPSSPPVSMAVQSVPSSPPVSMAVQSVPSSPPVSMAAQSMPSSPPVSSLT